MSHNNPEADNSSTLERTGFVPAATGARRSAALIVVLLAMFMDLLDNTVVNVALPSILREFDTTFDAIQWVAAGYTLAFAVALITGGRLGDIGGRRRIFLIGTVGFTIASALCGFAQSPAHLIGARVLQGLMSALMVPQVLAVIQTMYAPKDRGKAVAAFSGIAGLATVGGPILGALLTTSDIAGLGWRSVFLVNVPVGILTVILAAAFVPESTSAKARRLDVLGVVLATAALTLLVYPLIEGYTQDWPAWTFMSIAAGVLIFAILIAQQRHRTRVFGSPLIELSLFHQSSFAGGMAIAGLFMAGTTGFFFVFTVYLQTGLGYSVLASGLTTIPWGLLVPIFAGIAAGVLSPRLGRRTVQLGLFLTTCAMLVLMWTVTHPPITPWTLAPGLAIGGAGMGMVVASLIDFTLADVPVHDVGSASGLYNTVQQVGSAIGIAAVGSVFFGRLAHAPEPGQDLYSTTLQLALSLPVTAFAIGLVATLVLPRFALDKETG